MNQDNEIFDVVDQADRIIGQATRREVHARGWMHRSVHILVFNSDGDLFLQKRALTKDENPGYWDTSAAGHVNAGEDYLTCAHRELMEELGIAGDLKPFVSLEASPETFWEHVRSYLCWTDSPIRINPDEISEGRYWTLEAIQTSLAQGSVQFTSTFRILFDNYLKNKT